MGCYDGAEVCELVGTYLLNQLMVVIAKENMELYRHDGVGIFKSVSGIEVEFKTEELVTILTWTFNHCKNQPRNSLLY